MSEEERRSFDLKTKYGRANALRAIKWCIKVRDLSWLPGYISIILQDTVKGYKG